VILGLANPREAEAQDEEEDEQERMSGAMCVHWSRLTRGVTVRHHAPMGSNRDATVALALMIWESKR
jgi:hypothetical protein